MVRNVSFLLESGNKESHHKSESLFHLESLTTLRKEQDRNQKRVSQMYDDKLDGLIDEKMYLDKVRDYKARQAAIIEQMARYEQADENFYITANMVMNLALVLEKSSRVLNWMKNANF
jgi:site-specific DNA recombinase